MTEMGKSLKRDIGPIGPPIRTRLERACRGSPSAGTGTICLPPAPSSRPGLPRAQASTARCSGADRSSIRSRTSRTIIDQSSAFAKKPWLRQDGQKHQGDRQACPLPRICCGESTAADSRPAIPAVAGRLKAHMRSGQSSVTLRANRRARASGGRDYTALSMAFLGHAAVRHPGTHTSTTPTCTPRKRRHVRGAVRGRVRSIRTVRGEERQFACGRFLQARARSLLTATPSSLTLCLKNARWETRISLKGRTAPPSTRRRQQPRRVAGRVRSSGGIIRRHAGTRLRAACNGKARGAWSLELPDPGPASRKNAIYKTLKTNLPARRIRVIQYPTRADRAASSAWPITRLLDPKAAVRRDLAKQCAPSVLHVRDVWSNRRPAASISLLAVETTRRRRR